VLTIFIDADACPVKNEVYRVASRYGMKVMVVAKSLQRVPTDELVQMIVCRGFGEVDDWIAEQAGVGVITTDIPLAARCLYPTALVLSPKGHAFTEKNIGDALALRELTDELRQGGMVTGGPSAMTPRDRSRFLAKLDEVINAVRRLHL
jgi:uncharacterized protein YaiI (UPF0178 family)